jgi:hypothetical protein
MRAVPGFDSGIVLPESKQDPRINPEDGNTQKWAALRGGQRPGQLSEKNS